MRPPSQPARHLGALAKQAARRALAGMTAASMQAMNAVKGMARPEAAADDAAGHSSFHKHRETAVQAVTHDFKVLIHEAELDNIAGWVLKDSHQETGGDLFGFWTNTRSPSVQFVLGPGPRARHQVAAFYQDVDYLRLSQRIARTAHGLQHIGEWHSHHRLGLAEPSGGDANTIANIFHQYPIDEFLLCIATIGQPGHADDLDTGHDDVRVGAFLFRRGLRGYQRGGWVLLPGASPVGERMREQGGLRGANRPVPAWKVRRVSLEQPAGQPAPPPQGWYAQPEGTRFLRAFDQQCRAAFSDCEMALENGVMAYAFATEGSAWEVQFPDRFPIVPAELIGERASVRHPLPIGPGTLAEAAEAMFAALCALVAAKYAPPAEPLNEPQPPETARPPIVPELQGPGSEMQSSRMAADLSPVIAETPGDQTATLDQEEIGIPAPPTGSIPAWREGINH